MSHRVAAIIPAAGSGSRMLDSEALPKALRPLAGRPLLQYALDLFAPLVDDIVVALPGDRLDTPLRVGPGLAGHAVIRSIAGGAERQDSVRLALESLPAEVELVLVHDAARPLVPADVVLRVLAALHAGAACVIPVIEVDDSMRRVSDTGEASTVVDRRSLRRVQTPQGFRAEVLRAAHQSASSSVATDDATLVEALGQTVVLVPGDPIGFKVTRPIDLLLAEAVLASREP